MIDRERIADIIIERTLQRNPEHVRGVVARRIGVSADNLTQARRDLAAAQFGAAAILTEIAKDARERERT